MTDSIFFGAVISVVGYLIGIFLRKKISVLNPLLVSIIFVIAVIKIFLIFSKNRTFPNFISSRVGSMIPKNWIS